MKRLSVWARVTLPLVAALFPLFHFMGDARAWDPIGDLMDPGRILRNAEREAREVLKRTDELRLEAMVQAGAPLLQSWLEESRRTAARGAMPIPPGIRKSLSSFYDASVLDRARYKIGDPGVFNLANLSIQYGGATAVTLDDIVVFTNQVDAETNPVLWAHELKHVQQFRDWGIRDFSIRYLRSWNGVEDEAYAAEAAFQTLKERAPVDADFNGDGYIDVINLGPSSFEIDFGRSGQHASWFINPDYNTRIGVWLDIDVNSDGCMDLAHIITEGVNQPHYAHTHRSQCNGTFGLPDKIQFNAPGVANPQGDYNTALGFWTVKYCGGRPVLAHNPMLPDGRNHFWYPQTDGPLPYRLSNECL